MQSPHQTFELLVLGEGVGPDPLQLQVPTGATVRYLIEYAIAQGFPAAVVEELAVFTEDGETELEIDALLIDVGVSHGSRLHCHRCRHIAVTVTYGGKEETQVFRPGATVHRITKWAVQRMDLPEGEYALRTAKEETLPAKMHIGSLVRHEDCRLLLMLVKEVTQHGHRVKIYNEDNGREADLTVLDEMPISTIIAEMYTRFNIERLADDRLHCETSGEDVFAFAHMSLGDYLRAGHCCDLVWIFAGGTGGA